jgi:hypothetical protein
MWYTQKRYSAQAGMADGEILSPASAAVIRRHPLVR